MGTINLGKQFFGWKIFRVKNILASKEIVGKKKLGQKSFGSQEIVW